MQQARKLAASKSGRSPTALSPEGFVAELRSGDPRGQTHGHRIRVQRRIGHPAVDRPAFELGQRRHRHRKRDGVCERRRRDRHRLGAVAASANPAQARSQESTFVRSEAPFLAERFMVTLGQLFALQDQLKSASCAGVARRTSELGYWSSVAR